MIAAGSFRWLLALVTLFTPFAATASRGSGTRSDPLVRQDVADHVVFRHYL